MNSLESEEDQRIQNYYLIHTGCQNNMTQKKLVRHQLGFFHLDPIPSENEVEKYYLDEFYGSSLPNFNDSSIEVQLKQKDFFDLKWRLVFEKCSEIYGKSLSGSSVYDVGFGYGQALKYFMDNEVQGFGNEPSRECCEFVKKLGANVHQGGIEDFTGFPEKKFEIVLLLNVLEHLRNPLKTLEDIKIKLMKSDSMLVIDVPNEFNIFQLAANKIYDLREWWVVPPRHINYFSAESIRSLLENVGFEIIYQESSFPLEIFILMGMNYVGDSKIGSDIHSFRTKFEQNMVESGNLIELRNFYEKLAKLNLGRQVITYAKLR
jgi:SAM-dependent methyltransferase